ncbi:hypothetical protein DV736_g5987, partial [Chaetothyriales sp. CBS 134916]
MDPAMVRSLYLDATKYMVLSIPANLTSQEMALVRTMIPKEIITTDELMRTQVSEPTPTKSRSNVLRLGVANITGYMMALLFFLIPLFVTCINWILLYERQHQFSERALSYSIKLGKELGERGSEIPSAYQKFRYGPFGNALVTSGSWLAEGIAGGIVDGMQTAQDYHFQGQITLAINVDPRSDTSPTQKVTMQLSKLALVLAAAVSSVTAASISHNHAHLHKVRRVDHSEDQIISKRGILSTDIAQLVSIGLTKIGINSFTPTSNAWVGDDGDYTNVFENVSGENVILVIWGVAGSWVGGLNPVQPLITYSLAPLESVVVSFAEGASGGWAGIYPDTVLVNGQIFNSWGEYTFNQYYSTVDVSREPNMNGNNMTIVTPSCVSNMDTCVFVCKDGAISCWLDYELLNCDAANGGGSDASAQNGGCNGITPGSQLKTYL